MFLWVDYPFSISSYYIGITLTKSLPDIGGTTIQYVGSLAPMEPGVHTMSLYFFAQYISGFWMKINDEIRPQYLTLYNS